jgi:holo-[acyl-carrier protein] synthase
VFSEEEQAYCNKTARPECHYATRFAAKEAVLKALGTGFSEGIGVRDVEVVLNSKGKPHIKLYRRAAEIAREMNVKDIPLSLSYTQKDAVACALVLMDDEEKQEAKKDPLKELQQQFKEVRSMLDDL